MKTLVITHDDLLARAYQARLAREGFEVERCRTAHQGLAKARRWNPDILLLDLTLPGMHGLDVLKWLRDIPWLVQTVHVVLLAERTISTEVLAECLLWGADSYVWKDQCPLDVLVEQLRTLTRPAAPSA